MVELDCGELEERELTVVISPVLFEGLLSGDNEPRLLLEAAAAAATRAGGEREVNDCWTTAAANASE